MTGKIEYQSSADVVGAFILEKKFRFEAAHLLENHDGKCARLHGHSWNGRVTLKGYGLNISGPKENMLIDYSDISSVLDRVVNERLDHYYLNESLSCCSPTSEFIARWLFEYLTCMAPWGVALLYSVTIEETCTSSCTYVKAR